MDDFNDNEHDWFFDLDESIKSVTTNQVESPNYCNNEIELTNFSALNVPIDESIFKKKLGVEGNNETNYTSPSLNNKTAIEPLAEEQNLSVEQTHNVNLSYDNLQSFVSTSNSNNVTENTYHTFNNENGYFNTSIISTNSSNSNYTILDSSTLPSTLNSNYVDCKPSTSSSSLNIAQNTTQVYQKYGNDSNNCALQLNSNDDWIQTSSQKTASIDHIQSISQPLINYNNHNLNSDNLQSQNLVISQSSLNTEQTVSKQFYQDTQIQVPTLITFNQSVQRKSPNLEQPTYQPIQPSNANQQISYIDTQHVPYMQKNLSLDTTSEIQMLHHPVESSVTNSNNYNVIIQQPQQINQINLVSNQTLQPQHLTNSNFLSTVNSQEAVILPQNSQLLNTAHSNQQFYNNITVQSSTPQLQSQDVNFLNNIQLQQQSNTLSNSQTTYQTLPLTGKRTQRINNRRQSKQLGQSGFHMSTGSSSSGDGPVNTLGAVMQKIYATTGDMNAAVRFTPEMAVEFSQIASQLNELKEQQERTGINLSDQIKACEERIVKFLSVAEPTTQTTPLNATQKNSNSQTSLNNSTTSTTLLKPTSRGKTQRKSNNLYSSQSTATNNVSSIGYQLQSNNSFYQNVSANQTSTEQTSNFVQPNQIIRNSIETPVLINNVHLDQQNHTCINQTINAQQNVQYTTIHEIPQQSVVIPNTQAIELPKPINFGSTKRARGWAAKYQEIQVQKSQQQNAQAVTMVEMHPMLAGHITSQHLSQIISAAGINNTSPTTILVEFNGQQLPIVVSTTLSTNAPIQIKSDFQNKDVIHKDNSIIPNNNFIPMQNDVSLQSTTVNQLLDIKLNQIGLESNTKNFKTKKGGGRRSSLIVSESNLVLSCNTNSTPSTQSTSLNLDNTMEKVVSSAKAFSKRSATNNFSYGGAQSGSVASVLETQYLKPLVKRRPRIKNTYNEKERKLALSPPIVLLSSNELGKKIFEKKNERKSKLENYFEKLRGSLDTIDLSSNFKNKFDCFNRLLPFALFGEPSLDDKFFEQFDYGYLKHSINICERIEKMKSKFQNILFKDSLIENSFKTELNMLLYLDDEYEKRLLQKETAEFCSKNNLSSCITKNIDNILPIKSKCLMDFEYHEFCESKYLNISPYQSPKSFQLIENESSYEYMSETDYETSVDSVKSEPLNEEDSLINNVDTLVEEHVDELNNTVYKNNNEVNKFNICKTLFLNKTVEENKEIVLIKKTEEENQIMLLKDSILEKIVYYSRTSVELCLKNAEKDTKIEVRNNKNCLKAVLEKEDDCTDNNLKKLNIENLINTSCIKKEEEHFFKNNTNLENELKTNNMIIENIKNDTNDLNSSFLNKGYDKASTIDKKINVKTDFAETNKNQFLPPVKLKIKLSGLNITFNKEKNGVVNKNEEKLRKKEEKRIKKEEKRELKKQRKLKKIQEKASLDLEINKKLIDEDNCSKNIEEYESECQTNGLKIKIFTRKVNLNTPTSNSNNNNSSKNFKSDYSIDSFDESSSLKQSTSNKLPEKNPGTTENNESLKLRISKLLLPSCVLKNNTNSYNNCSYITSSSHSVSKTEINQDNNIVKKKIEKRQKNHRKRKIEEDPIEAKLLNKEQDVFMPPLKIRFKKFSSENYLSKTINAATFTLEKSNNNLNKQTDRFKKNLHCKKSFIAETTYIEQQNLITNENPFYKKDYEIKMSDSDFVTDFSCQTQQKNYYSTEKNLFNGYLNNCLSNNKIMFDQLLPKNNWNTKVIKQVQFSPSSEDDSDDIRLRDKTDKLLNKLINKEQSQV